MLGESWFLFIWWMLDLWLNCWEVRFMFVNFCYWEVIIGLIEVWDFENGLILVFKIYNFIGIICY